MEKRFRVELLGWGKVTNLVGVLAAGIKASGYQPDVVIAIARGGYVPARLLCDYLDIYDLTSIRIAHYTAGARKSEAARLQLPLNVDIHGLKVLLVDDVDDTGDTLQLALDHIQEFEPRAIKVAVLHHKIISTVVPDFYAQKIVRWRWLTYPWALIEDIQGFIQRLEPKPANPRQACLRLEQEYALKIPLRTMEDIYRTQMR